MIEYIDKTCVLLSGRITGWKNCSLLKTLSNYSYDIYCSLNDDPNNEEIKEFAQLDVVKAISYLKTDALYTEWVSNAPAPYETNKLHTFSQFLHNKLVFNMTLPFRYKTYIKFRADIITDFLLPLVSELNSTTIIIPEIFRYGYNGHSINDQIAVGNFYSMQIYCCVFDNLLKYLKNGILFHPETMLSVHLQQNTITVNCLDYCYNLYDGRKNL